MINLIKGDCLEVMKTIPDGSIDAIITDPPYAKTRGRWDSVIDLDLMWTELKRIIKPNGAIVLFGNEPFSSKVRCSNLDEYRYDWKWVKNRATGFPNCNYRPMNKYEDIMVFSKANASTGGKKNSMEYYPQNLIVSNKVKKNTPKRHGLIQKDTNNVGKNNILMQPTEYVQKFTNYPNNVLNFNCESKYVHPTQKPILLMEYLISTYTNEGETVLDFTMGSGSTGVAAKNTNRNFIGIEMDENYFNIAKQRINEQL
jgi:site-specific DNA-methyltransferase (adenine-specific)